MASQATPPAEIPRLVYFNFQGRAEVLRLALAAAGVDFEFEEVDKEELKSNLQAFHFAQVPRYIDAEVDLCQTNAILRHLARKHGLYGANAAEQARVDEVIEGAQDLAGMLFLGCVLRMKEAPAAKEDYFAAHVNAGSEGASTARGSHAGFLSRLLSANASGWFVESGLTVADLMVCMVTDMHLRVFGRDRIAGQWPDLVDHHARVLEQPRIAAYRESDKCLPTVAPLLPS